MLFYSFMLTVVLLLGAPYWLLRMATTGRYRAGLAGRLGIIPPALRRRLTALRVERRGGGGQRPIIWVHAVSVGEVLAAARLIEEFRNGEFHRKRPGMVFAVSTTTEAGQRLAQERLPDCAIFYFPLDLGFAIRRYLRLLEPEMIVLLESELWPQLISQAAKAGVPLAVVNARISDRSFPRYMRLKALWRPLLAKVSIFLAQSPQAVERLRQIGAPRVELAGNLKYDARLAKESALVTTLRTRMPQDVPVLVCGSTLEGEEILMLDAWARILEAYPKAVLVLAPRHPDRFDAVADLVRGRSLSLARASTFLRTKATIKPGGVFLLDTIGDLAAVYGLGTIAFVGGSLVDAGGHNPLEPAQFGVPVLIGPSFSNFREIVEAMQAKDGIRIVTAEWLSDALLDTMRDRNKAEAMGANGKAVSAAQSGAAARTAAALLNLLPPEPVSADGSRAGAAR